MTASEKRSVQIRLDREEGRKQVELIQRGVRDQDVASFVEKVSGGQTLKEAAEAVGIALPVFEARIKEEPLLAGIFEWANKREKNARELGQVIPGNFHGPVEYKALIAHRIMGSKFAEQYVRYYTDIDMDADPEEAVRRLEFIIRNRGLDQFLPRTSVSLDRVVNEKESRDARSEEELIAEVVDTHSRVVELLENRKKRDEAMQENVRLLTGGDDE